MKKIQSGIALLLLLAMLFSLSACQKAQGGEGQDAAETPRVSSIYVYTLNYDRDFISRMVREFPNPEDVNTLIIEEMMRANQKLFPRNTKLHSVSVEGSAATVDFSKELSGIDQETFLFINELCAISLAQGGSVQGDKISTMTLLCDGEPLEGYYQYPYQVHLVDYAEEENLNVTVLKLYYPDREGLKLWPEYRLVPLLDDLDKTMMYELFAGTEDPQHKMNVIPSGTQFTGLTASGNTYTIDLNGAFLANRQEEPTTNLLAIQSVVATLTEFTVIDQVKFNVEGKSSGVAFGEIGLDQPITLKADLLGE